MEESSLLFLWLLFGGGDIRMILYVYVGDVTDGIFRLKWKKKIHFFSSYPLTFAHCSISNVKKKFCYQSKIYNIANTNV